MKDDRCKHTYPHKGCKHCTTGEVDIDLEINPRTQQYLDDLDDEGRA